MFSENNATVYRQNTNSMLMGKKVGQEVTVKHMLIVCRQEDNIS